MAAPAAPKGLGPRGRALWRAVWASLPTGDDGAPAWELDEVERAVLATACRAADRTVELEHRLEQDGIMVPGSAGQPVAHPLLGELRQVELEVGKLLDRLRLPDAAESATTGAAERARRAASARWGDAEEAS